MFTIGLNKVWFYDCENNQSRMYFLTYQDTTAIPAIPGAPAIVSYVAMARTNGQLKSSTARVLSNGYRTPSCCRALRDWQYLTMPQPSDLVPARRMMKEGRIVVGPGEDTVTWPATYRATVSYR